MSPFRLAPWASVPVLFLGLVPLHAQIAITDPPTTDPFPAIPSVTDWSTAGIGTATDATITDAAGFDAKVIATLDSVLVFNVLGSSGTFPPSTNAIARWNNGTAAAAGGNSFLQTRPTGTDYTVLMATIANRTTAPITGVTVTYDYSKATDTASETIKGLRAYWSPNGAAGSWQLLPGLSKDTTGTVDTPESVTGSITFPTALPVDGTFVIAWADQNSSGTDASYHIDNFRVAAGAAPICAIAGSATAATRSAGANPADPTDDVVNFDVTINGTGPLSPLGWTVAAPAGLVGFTTGPYDTAHTVANAPVANFTNGRMIFTVQDAAAGAACQTSMAVRCPVVLATNDIVSPGRPMLSTAAAPDFWAYDEAARTFTQSNAAQGDRVLTTEEITLPGGSTILFTGRMVAEAGTSSGFEAADSFALQLIVDGGAPVSVLGSADVDGDGRLLGAATGGLELPDATQLNTSKEFTFSALIPPTATRVAVRIIGNSNSPSETFVVSNLRFSVPPPSITLSSGGPSTLINNGTDTPTDDLFSGLVNVTPVNFAGTAWNSNETPTRTGPYSPPARTFGPYPISGGAFSVAVFDQTTPTIFSNGYEIPLPPAATLAATTPNNITIQPDGSVTFDAVVTGTNGGPRFTVTGATPNRDTYGTAPVRFTIPAPLPAAPISVTITDVSYPTATQTVSVTPPSEFVIGQTNFGFPDNLRTVTADAPWTNNVATRTITMNAGTLVESIVASTVIDLTSVGEVTFTGTFTASDTSVGTNFEVTDRFRAELIVDGGLPTQQVINLVDAYDKGNGASATVAPGTNGPKDGYINGYNGTAALDLLSSIDYSIPPLTAEDEYNANLARDEFNALGEVADAAISNQFPLAATIPAAANTVQLRILSTGINGSETGEVSDVLFSGVRTTNDNDGDGITNTDEAIMGTDPNNAGDALRLTQNPSTPTQMTFPTVAGRFYRVYTSNDADAASHLQSWRDAGLATIVGNGATAAFSVAVDPGQPRRFYRLHVMQSDGPWPATRP